MSGCGLKIVLPGNRNQLPIVEVNLPQVTLDITGQKKRLFSIGSAVKLIVSWHLNFTATEQVQHHQRYKYDCTQKMKSDNLNYHCIYPKQTVAMERGHKGINSVKCVCNKIVLPNAI